jgi:hypothetical protein
MGIDSHLSTCVGTQLPKYLEMAHRHISLSVCRGHLYLIYLNPCCYLHRSILYGMSIIDEFTVSSVRINFESEVWE